MSKRAVAVGLTLCYWFSTLPLAWFGAQPDTSGFLLVWYGVVVLFALPVTVILWIMGLIDRWILKSRLPLFAFIALGVAMPPIYILFTYKIPMERQSRASQRIIEEGSAAIVESVSDDLLIDSKGPIGVRLRYRIKYPRGLEMDSRTAPTAYLYGQAANKQDVGFVILRRAVTPTVSGNFPPGTYTITEDRLPAFMPPSMLPTTDATLLLPIDPKTGRQPVTPRDCFRWTQSWKRVDIEHTSAQALHLSIFPGLAAAEPTSAGMTSHTYSMADFLAIADQEQAHDCSP